MIRVAPTLVNLACNIHLLNVFLLQQADRHGLPCPHPQRVSGWPDSPSGETREWPQTRSKFYRSLIFLLSTNSIKRPKSPMKLLFLLYFICIKEKLFLTIISKQEFITTWTYSLHLFPTLGLGLFNVKPVSLFICNFMSVNVTSPVWFWSYLPYTVYSFVSGRNQKGWSMFSVTERAGKTKY